MTVELLQTLSKVSFAVSGVLLVAAIAMFFLLEIKRVIGDVTGTTAKKAIDDIRKQNEQTGNKAYKPSPVNKSRGKVTDKISTSGQIVPTPNVNVSVGTAELSDDTQVLYDQDMGAGETVVLNAEPMPENNETTVLNVESTGEFSIDYELCFCGSDEIIN